MKRLFFAIVAMLALVSCTDKIVAVGSFVTNDVNVAVDATAITIQSTMKLTLSDDLDVGQMTISTHENIHNYIDVVESDGKVQILLENNNYKKLNIKVVASAKQFCDVKASGASEVTVKSGDLAFDDYKIALSGASKFTAATPIATKTCSVQVSGASRVVGRRIAAEDVEVDLSGESAVDITASNTITGELSGASMLHYWGSPVVTVTLTGASTVGGRE